MFKAIKNLFRKRQTEVTVTNCTFAEDAPPGAMIEIIGAKSIRLHGATIRPTKERSGIEVVAK